MRKKVKIKEEGKGRYVVVPEWEGVDRPITASYSCGFSKALAERLQMAMVNDAVWAEPPHIKTDTFDKTFVSASLNIRMRCANADLKRIGY